MQYNLNLRITWDEFDLKNVYFCTRNFYTFLYSVDFIYFCRIKKKSMNKKKQVFVIHRDYIFLIELMLILWIDLY